MKPGDRVQDCSGIKHLEGRAGTIKVAWTTGAKGIRKTDWVQVLWDDGEYLTTVKAYNLKETTCQD